MPANSGRIASGDPQRPWPGDACGACTGDRERYVKGVLDADPGGPTGTAAPRAVLTSSAPMGAPARTPNGCFWIMGGRVDDVINVVGGNRLGGTMEVESALVSQPGRWAEAAGWWVDGRPHEIKGTGICAFCSRLKTLTSSKKPEGRRGGGRDGEAQGRAGGACGEGRSGGLPGPRPGAVRGDACPRTRRRERSCVRLLRDVAAGGGEDPRRT